MRWFYLYVQWTLYAVNTSLYAVQTSLYGGQTALYAAKRFDYLIARIKYSELLNVIKFEKHVAKMEEILQELGFGNLVNAFLKEKLTPDIVESLSILQMEQLGVKDRSDMMKLRVKCLPYGRQKPRKTGRNFEIPKEVLENLLESNFTIMDISNILSVSESTVYRKMRMYDLSKHDFNDIEDGALDQIVKDVMEEFPHSGEVMIGQILRQKKP